MDNKDLEKLDENVNILFKRKVLSPLSLNYAIIGAVLFFIIWAALSKIDERTIITGSVIPSSHIQHIQNLEGGIIKQISVHEGDIVRKGQVLAKLDDTKAAANYQEMRVNYYALLAKQYRLQAQVDSKPNVDFPDEIKKEAPNAVKNEQSAFNAAHNQQKSSLSTLSNTLTLVDKEIAITKPLAKEQIVPELDLIKLQREREQILGQLQQTKHEYVREASEELANISAKASSLGKSIQKHAGEKQRTTIISPVSGIVKHININTVGGVLKPGENIMEIVPTDGSLLIAGKAQPNKIAFIHSGQTADVSISAYDTSIYGSLEGKVVRVSADAISEKGTSGMIETYYKVIIKTKNNHLMYNGKSLPIIPGMQVTANVLTGKKTILNYILKPLMKAKQVALTER